MGPIPIPDAAHSCERLCPPGWLVGVDTGGAGYAFAKTAAAHYINDFARALAPFSIRMDAVHPTNANTDMLHSAPMYRAFRPDLANPTREDAEPVFPLVQARIRGADPLCRTRGHQRGGAVSHLRRGALHHRPAAAGGWGRLPQSEAMLRHVSDWHTT
uniref:(-)-trans-carveol dehydrogenase n=1 Tax=Mycobacterium riyadhense TaxID=486698 RepID=A0A653F523_9MYCO|nr:(-)-trans-carveol dehydrogenase [Mycobacterium riyadhense]